MIKVISPGIYTSVQDLGRFGYAAYGVPMSGAMDQYSAKLANYILDNNVNDSVLEITLGRCRLLIINKLIIAVTGANLLAKLNGVAINLNSAIEVFENDELTFDKPEIGVRSYLAVKGGFQSKMLLNSRSYFKGITDQFLVQKNYELKCELNTDKLIANNALIKVDKEHFKSTTIETYQGPEYYLLNKAQKQYLNRTKFTISKENSRMGYRLEEHLKNDLKTMLSSAVLPGTVQLTPSGKLIVLMRDCQVTGGYPRILQLTDTAINRMAQKTTKDHFKFKLKTIDESY